MATLLRLEIWTAYECDSGTREAVLARDECPTLMGTERITREDALTLLLPKSSAAADSFALGRVIRLVYDDASFDEWRIHELVDQSGIEGGRYRVTCRSVLYELRDLALIATTASGVLTTSVTYAGKTASEIVTGLLTYLPGWWAVGTITPTLAISVSVTADATPLRVLRELVRELNAGGAACELDVRRNGTTGYLIDIVTAIGASAETPDIRTSKNILTSDRTRSRETMANRVYPRGADDASIEYAYWRVISVSGNDIEIRQAETDAAAINFDDQLNGLYLENDAGTRVAISASVAATSIVTVSSSAGFAVGEWCRLVADGAGTGISYLSYPGAVSTKVSIVEGAGDGTTNLCDNPYMSRWPGSTSAAPTGWASSGGGTYTQNTTAAYIQRGTYSCRCQFSAGSQFLRTNTQTILTGRGTTYSAKVALYRVSGTLMQVAFYNQAGVVLGAAVSVPATVGWHELTVTGVAIGAATGLYVAVVSTGVAECYVDSAQITVGAVQAPWTLGSAPASLYRLGLGYLADNAFDPTQYTLTVADLNRLSPIEWPYDALVLGASVRITDTELGITTTSRITEITRDYRNPAKTTLVLERTTRTLTTVLASAA